jgi:hypothetical protein
LLPSFGFFGHGARAFFLLVFFCLPHRHFLPSEFLFSLFVQRPGLGMNVGDECLSSGSELACAADVLRRELDKVFLTYDEIFNLHFWLNWFKVLASRQKQEQKEHEERELTLPVPLATFLWALLRKRNLVGTDNLMDLMQRSLPRNFFQTRVVFFGRDSHTREMDQPVAGDNPHAWTLNEEEQSCFLEMLWKRPQAESWPDAISRCRELAFPVLQSRTGSQATLRLLADQTIIVKKFEALPGCIMVEVEDLSEDEATELISGSQSPTAESVWTATLADDIVCVAERFANWKQERANNNIKVARIVSVFRGKRADFPKSYTPACLTRIFRVSQVPNIKTLLCVPILCYIWSAEVAVTVREPGTLPSLRIPGAKSSSNFARCNSGELERNAEVVQIIIS